MNKSQSLGYKLGSTPKLHMLRKKGDAKAICGATKNFKLHFEEHDWNFVCKKCLEIYRAEKTPF